MIDGPVQATIDDHEVFGWALEGVSALANAGVVALGTWCQ